MLKNGIEIYYYYESIWNTGELIYKSNKKIGYFIKLFSLSKINQFFNYLKEKDKEKCYSLFNYFSRLENEISNEELEINLSIYSKYVKRVFDLVNNEDLNGDITYKTVKKFIVTADLIEVFEYFNSLDENMLKIQQYFRYKAYNIQNCLNNGINPIRGGFNEFKYNPNLDCKIFIQFNNYKSLNLNNYSRNNNNEYFRFNSDSINQSNEKDLNNNFNGSFPTINTFHSARKSYTNHNSNSSNLKESILSFDEKFLKKKSNDIKINNINAIKELKYNNIHQTIQILNNSIKLLKKFPKQTKQGFF